MGVGRGLLLRGVLCRTLGRLEDVERVGATLRGYYLYADHQHAALAAGLGLHMYTVGGNYADVLRQCGIQFIFPEERLLWVGPRGRDPCRWPVSRVRYRRW